MKALESIEDLQLSRTPETCSLPNTSTFPPPTRLLRHRRDESSHVPLKNSLKIERSGNIGVLWIKSAQFGLRRQKYSQKKCLWGFSYPGSLVQWLLPRANCALKRSHGVASSADMAYAARIWHRDWSSRRIFSRAAVWWCQQFMSF